MLRDLAFILFGYCLGSILFADFFVRLFARQDITELSEDKNPGAFNAYAAGGFLCGTLTLICDLGKGFLPVFLYGRGAASPFLIAVLAAPVLGHIFPIFSGFRGGKGIATTFGCLLGLAPNLTPALILAVFFLLFAAVLRLPTHYHTTLAAYLCSECAMPFFVDRRETVWGFSLIFLAVMARMLTGEEAKKRLCRSRTEQNQTEGQGNNIPLS